ncbi:hypothetical protein [Angustibacter sp. Root456]|uniref:hypothetical protein n=1 Tax=Angustibacter sp. Root456 TaxID=1736539 RepID=UPI00070194E9|nr:hypothetical protein [Angustibacter sp. Root456]KQX61923.1 hypothetical protein ASD06_15375 [Angustibacter sp. Root456]
MLLSGCVLTVTATTAIVGVAAAAGAPATSSTRDGVRLEALVVDQEPNPLPAVTATVSGLPHKPLALQVRAAAAPHRQVVRRAAVKRPARSKPVRPSTTLHQAVARIPRYGAHRPTRWVLTSQYGHYGATDLGSGTVYISPSVPASRLDSVVRHEWAHVLQIRVYGSASATIAGLNAAFGGSGMTGLERAADCMAVQLGATWTNYTSCSSPAWQRAASRLLAGRRP